MIPKNITKKHILQAIEELKVHGVPKGRQSRKFILEYLGMEFPTKYTISLANKYANGKELDPESYSGGKESNNFLMALGFKVFDITTSDQVDQKKPSKKKKLHTRKASHNESCRDCKKIIQAMLEKIYGKVETNYKFSIGTKPESFRKLPHYQALKDIYTKLQKFRGHERFIKAKTLPNCDYYIHIPGFILEFDESQHFTKPREIALKNYPKGLKVGFDVGEWIKRCIALNKKDNDPVYRDEQRAWYDTMRDFCSSILNVPVVRVLPDEHRWCDLNPNEKSDIDWFRNFIDNKLQYISAQKDKQKKSLKIGLAFPELGKHSLKDFLSLIRNHYEELDLLIFPEGFEDIDSTYEIEPDSIHGSKELNRLADRYKKICKDYSLNIIVGVSVNYQDASIHGGGNDQYCLFIKPTGETTLYHKHSTSRLKAFFDSNWSIGSSFPVVQADNIKIGLSICHDMYNGLIPKVLQKKGSDIWVNISYQNVRPRIWESVLHTRAIENKFVALCTLHCNRNESNPQKEPYAFSKKGKIKLKDIETNMDLTSISFEKRIGKIYYFDTFHYETYPLKQIGTREISEKAKTIRLNLNKKYEVVLQGTDIKYRIEEVAIKDFIFSPEKLWEISLKRIDRIPVFIVVIKDEEQWEKYAPTLYSIIRGRVIEFSTIFLFTNKPKSKIFMCAYRSSNYKDSRVFYPKRFPIKIDQRFLKGLESTYKISLNDPRKINNRVYFERVDEIIDFLKN